MKKKISLVLAFLMAATMLAGCKKTDEEAPGLPEVETTMPSLTEMTMEEVTEETVPTVGFEETTTAPEETTAETTTTTAPAETEAPETSETTAEETTTAASETEETTTATEAAEWSETEISETLYIQTSCYSRVKAIVGSESVKKYEKGTKINIVAATDTGYYKLADGTFIHSDYVTDEAPSDSDNDEIVTEAMGGDDNSSDDNDNSNNNNDDDRDDDNGGSSSSKPLSTTYTKNYKDRYAYKKLSSEEKKLYAAIVKGAENFQTQVELPGTYSSDDVFKVYALVFNQEPQLFWLSPSAPASLGGILHMEYDITRDEAAAVQKEIDANVKSIMSKVGGYSSTVSRLKAIYDWVITNNTFSLQGSFATCGVYNGLTDGGELQCQGYAKTVQYLCDMAGIECMVVNGNNAEGSTHAWNVVYCENGYYILDTTWGDPETSYGKSSYVRYLFFLTNDEMTENTHLNVSTMVRSSTGKRIDLYTPPACTKTACYYFKAYEKEYDSESAAYNGMKAEIKAAVKAGKNVAHIRVTSHDLWETMRSNSYWKKYQDYAKSLDSNVKELKRQTTLTEDVLVVEFDIVYK